ncbi:unnamed protein product [Camellia sinensis]
MENRACISFRIPSGVVPKNMEGLKVKFSPALLQSFNYLYTQRKGIAFQFCLSFCPSTITGTLHTKIQYIQFNLHLWNIKNKVEDLGADLR